MTHIYFLQFRKIAALASITALAACSDGFDFDLRDRAGGFDTTNAARVATEPRPTPDNRGVISYPSYQVVVARRGDSLQDIATRVGLPAAEIAQYNGLPVSYTPRAGEILALPRRVPGGAAGGDITSIASGAIDRASGTSSPTSGAAPGEPVRHKVAAGETTYSIARLYNVTPGAIGEWNGLDRELTVREGQFLLIPVARQQAASASGGAVQTTTIPGAGSVTPVPPSASDPLPQTATAPVAAAKPAAPSSSKLLRPVEGSVLRPYVKGKSTGIDYAASTGKSVLAAGDGTVLLITVDTDQVPILVIQHPANLLTVYANITGIAVKKGDAVRRGQPVAKVGKGNPSFLHFEVRKGSESVDPAPYLE